MQTHPFLDSRFRGNDGKLRPVHHAFPVGYITENALRQAAEQLAESKKQMRSKRNAITFLAAYREILPTCARSQISIWERKLRKVLTAHVLT